LFNDKTSLNFSDIRDQTQLVDKELIRTLQSLVDVQLITMPEVRFTEKIECKFIAQGIFYTLFNRLFQPPVC